MVKEHNLLKLQNIPLVDIMVEVLLIMVLELVVEQQM